MNCSFSRFILPALLVCYCSFVNAVDIMAIYSTSCNRFLGIPLDVSIGHIYFLNLNGVIEKIPRYNVIAIASYPLNEIPIKTVKNNLKQERIDYFIIKTRYNNKIVPLVEGWPVQFFKDRISFLNSNGQEALIDRQNIWDINLVKTPRFKKLQGKVLYRYEFVHPFMQYDCARSFYGNPKNSHVIKVFPQEYSMDQVAIKRRFDSTMRALAELRDYYREQKFYAIPQVYKNQTTLGYWASIGSRHGKSQTRDNNLAPVLVNEYSERPFGYQHILISGNAPHKEFVHEEAQTQFYYRLKADYFHFSFLYDLNRFLIADYNWQKSDFKGNDDKHANKYSFTWGLDFGQFSFILASPARINHGFQVDGKFAEASSSINRFGLRYQNHFMLWDIIYGNSSGDDETVEFSALRSNLDLDLWKKISLGYSFIHRDFKEKTYNIYHSTSYTHAFFGAYRWKYKYIFKGMLGYEGVKIMDDDMDYHLKLGLSAHLVF